MQWRDKTTKIPGAVRTRRCTVLMLALAVSGCTLMPAGAARERARLEAQASTYRQERADRALPEVPVPAGCADVLARAFAANGALEAAYFEWKTAVEGVSAAAGYPNTNLVPSFSYMFSGERMTRWDRSTLGLGFDGMENLAFPAKVGEAAERALEEARAAGQRFEAARFGLQRNVREAYLHLLLLDAKIYIQEKHVALLHLMAESAESKLRSGAAQREFLDAEIAMARADDELARLRAERRARASALNGLLARAPDAVLVLARALPAPALRSASDADLLAAGVAANPELAALAADVAGREDALELARLQYVPDLNPFVGLTGNISRMAGFGLVLPTTLVELRAGVSMAASDLRRARAVADQARLDRAAQFVAELVMVRDSERHAALFDEVIIPAARRVVDNAAESYAVGAASYAELIDSQRALLDARLALVEARIERERGVAALEELMGVDAAIFEGRDAAVSMAEPTALDAVAARMGGAVR